MIYIFTTKEHSYTLKGLWKLRNPRVPFRPKSYEWLLKQKRINISAAIFTDFDRLNFDDHWKVEQIASKMDAAGVKILNRPARIKQRYELLRGLYDKGLNPYQVWRAEERPQIPEDKFPVFAKSEGAHAEPEGGLMQTQAEVDALIENLPEKGFAPRHFLIKQFYNKPIRDDVWTRYTTYKIGNTVFTGLAVYEQSPFVKYGAIGLATDQDFADTLNIYRANKYADEMSRFFDFAKIDYGRADFGIVDGKPVLFEINTNPTVPRKQGSRSAEFIAASMEIRRRIGDAVTSLGGPSIKVNLRDKS